MDYILSKLKCDVIFHCAAYKHVPLMEENPVAVIENNVFGTKNILDAAIKAKVSKFVLISTDKAVSPVSIYGASKMFSIKSSLTRSMFPTNSRKTERISFTAFAIIPFSDIAKAIEN